MSPEVSASVLPVRAPAAQCFAVANVAGSNSAGERSTPAFQSSYSSSWSSFPSTRNSQRVPSHPPPRATKRPRRMSMKGAPGTGTSRARTTTFRSTSTQTCGDRVSSRALAPRIHTGPLLPASLDDGAGPVHPAGHELLDGRRDRLEVHALDERQEGVAPLTVGDQGTGAEGARVARRVQHTVPVGRRSPVDAQLGPSGGGVPEALEPDLHRVPSLRVLPGGPLHEGERRVPPPVVGPAHGLERLAARRRRMQGR